MRVGVDIDGVLADSLTLWVTELNGYFNKNKRYEDILIYDLAQNFELTHEQLMEFAQEKGPYLMSSPRPIPCAAEYLRKIKEEHFVAIVTARQEKYREITERWLQRQGMPYDELYMSGTYKKEGLCSSLGLQVMIEDTWEIGAALSEVGIPVLLLDAPYNRRDLPNLVTRIYNWEEIYQTICSNKWPPSAAARFSGG